MKKKKVGKKTTMVIISGFMLIIIITTLILEVFLPMRWCDKVNSLELEEITYIKVIAYAGGDVAETIMTDKETIVRWYDLLAKIRVDAVPYKVLFGGSTRVFIMQDNQEIDFGFFRNDRICGESGGLFEFKIINFDDLADEYYALIDEAHQSFY